MKMPSPTILFVLFGIVSLTETVQAEWCYNYDGGSFYCSSGCCYSYGYEECCATDVEVPVWIIAVSVIGGILLLSFVACLVVVCCCKGMKAGRVIQPNNTMQPAYITATTSYPVQYYSMTTTTLPQPGLQPPAYQPNSNPKPAETYTANQREGIQSEPPVFGGLPGKHQVV